MGEVSTPKGQGRGSPITNGGRQSYHLRVCIRACALSNLKLAQHARLVHVSHVTIQKRHVPNPAPKIWHWAGKSTTTDIGVQWIVLIPHLDADYGCIWSTDLECELLALAISKRGVESVVLDHLRGTESNA